MLLGHERPPRHVDVAVARHRDVRELHIAGARELFRRRPGLALVRRTREVDRDSAVAGEARVREVHVAVAARSAAVGLDRGLVVELPEEVRCRAAVGHDLRVSESLPVVDGRSGGATRVVESRDPDVAEGLLGPGRVVRALGAEVRVAVAVPGDDRVARARRPDMRKGGVWRLVVGIARYERDREHRGSDESWPHWDLPLQMRRRAAREVYRPDHPGDRLDRLSAGWTRPGKTGEPAPRSLPSAARPRGSSNRRAALATSRVLAPARAPSPRTRAPHATIGDRDDSRTRWSGSAARRAEWRATGPLDRSPGSGRRPRRCPPPRSAGRRPSRHPRARKPARTPPGGTPRPSPREGRSRRGTSRAGHRGGP